MEYNMLLDNFIPAMGSAVSAGLGALTLRNKMRSLNEAGDDRASKTLAILTGLGGAYTGGGINGYYHSSKEEDAERERREASGEPMEMHKTNRTGRHMANSLLGSIPLVGSVTNYMAADARNKKLDELDAAKERSGKKSNR